MSESSDKEGGGKANNIKNDTASDKSASGGLDVEEIRSRLDKVIEESKSSKQKLRGNKDEDRSLIAILFVSFFLGAIALVLILVPLYNLYAFRHAPIAVDTTPAIQPLDLGTTLTEVGTILGPSVGFVVGYYFKDERARKAASKTNED
jgi:hypothetical protein